MITEYEQAILDAGIRLSNVFGTGYDYLEPMMWRIMQDPLKVISDAELWKKYDRFSFVWKYGFAIPDETALNEIAKHSPIIEIGAGPAYWAYELLKLHPSADIICTDCNELPQLEFPFEKQWMSITVMPAIEAVASHPDRTLMCIWPTYEQSWAADALKAYKGEKFIYCGEYGGCCADDEFFNVLENDWIEIADIDIPIWHGLHDKLWVYKRNK